MLFAQVRTVVNLNEGWQYFENTTREVTQYAEGVIAENINLPHTWNQWDAVDITPGYRRSASWYVKDLEMEISPNKKYILYFEGANISTDVYVNEKLAGSHIGGYVGFEIDITDFLEKSKKNRIEVRVDNSYNPDIIPSQKADFFIYGGITRDVWLKILPEDFIENVRVRTPAVSQEKASTEVTVFFEKKILESTVEIELYGPSGERVLKSEEVEIIDDKLVVELPVLKNPKLWSPRFPHLYELKFFLKQNGELIDEVSERIGYRYFHFEPHGAFYLNGEKIKIRGTHRHEEHAGCGAALSNKLHRQDVKMMKEMGVNFVRLAHYPQDPEVYRACDELGLMVWDELPWCRGGMGEDVWQKNTLNLLEEQILQNYNHPSILFWSLGNEIYWLPDFANGDDEKRINNFLKKLNDKAHELDPDRMTAIRKYYAGSDIVDVFSPSIWSGWYAGVYQNYEKTLEENRKKYPQFLHMEYGGSSHVGRHTEQPIDDMEGLDDANWAEVANQSHIQSIAKSGDWSENYMVDLFDWYLNVSENLDWFAGNAQWAFKDFGTPLRPENSIPYLNQKGLTDRAGNPKDAFYVFQSYWSEEPMIYIESKTWTERYGDKGESKMVDVYSNCETVELWLNGKTMGVKNRDKSKFPACGLRWGLTFSEGKNTIIAKGKSKEGVEVSDTLEVNYFNGKYGKPNAIYLTSEKIENGKILIVATIRDKEGRQVLDYEKRVYFSHDGAGYLLENYGTPTRSRIIEFANGRAAIEYVPGEGEAVIEARNQDFKGSYIRVNENGEIK